MAFIPAENTAKMELVFTDQGETVENVFHVLLDHQPDKDDLTLIAIAMRDWWDVELQGLVTGSVSLVRILGRDLTVEDGQAIEFTAGLPLVGGGAGPLPNNVTVVVKWSTGFAGRSFRGRTYHVGLPGNQLDTNTNSITAAHGIALDTAYELLIDAMQSSGWSLVVASFFHDGAPRAAAVLTPIEAAFINLDIDSQRRRLKGRGA
jgi:hypothetical protein